MLISKRCLPVLLILVLLVSACNLLESPPAPPQATEPPLTEEPTGEPAVGGVTAAPPTGSEGIPPGAPTPDLTGTWTGTLTENSGTLRTMTLDLYQSPPYTEITGTLNITAGEMVENYEISGGIEGIVLHVQTTGYNLYLTASYTAGTPETLTGNAAFDCYDCPEVSFGYFTLTRGPAMSIALPPPVEVNILGTWTGFTYETGGAMRTFNTVLVIEPGGGGTFPYYGTIDLTNPDGSFFQFYMLNIDLLGSDVQMSDSGTEVITQYFWGSVYENTFLGSISMEGFEMTPWANFTLTR